MIWFTNDTFPTEEKYYDVYKYSTNALDYSIRILGDAVGEIGPFLEVATDRRVSSLYDDWAEFMRENHPIQARGGGGYSTLTERDGSDSLNGIFAMGCGWPGNARQYASFKIVLSPK